MCIREGFKPRLSWDQVDSTSLTNSWVWPGLAGFGHSPDPPIPDPGLDGPGALSGARPGRLQDGLSRASQDRQTWPIPPTRDRGLPPWNLPNLASLNSGNSLFGALLGPSREVAPGCSIPDPGSPVRTVSGRCPDRVSRVRIGCPDGVRIDVSRRRSGHRPDPLPTPSQPLQTGCPDTRFGGVWEGVRGAKLGSKPTLVWHPLRPP